MEKQFWALKQVVYDNYTIMEPYDEVFAIFVIITVKWLNIVNFNTIQSQDEQDEQSKYLSI